MCFSDENRFKSLIIAQCLVPDWEFYVLNRSFANWKTLGHLSTL